MRPFCNNQAMLYVSRRALPLLLSTLILATVGCGPTTQAKQSSPAGMSEKTRVKASPETADAGVPSPDAQMGGAFASLSGQPPILLGSLSRSEIQHVIAEHRSHIRHCYEKELAKAPQLEGRVDISFVIGADGSVLSSKADGLDPNVASCLLAVIDSMTFPEPKGGGIVKVSYPFVFRAE